MNSIKKIVLTGLSATLIMFTNHAVAKTDFEINVSPLLFMGLWDAEVQFEITDNIQAGPVASFAKYVLAGNSVSFYSGGLRAEYGFNGFDSNGFYGATKFTYGSGYVNLNSYSCSLSSIDAKAIAGYALRSKKGWNIKVGAAVVQSVYLDDEYQCDGGATEALSENEGSLQTSFGLDLTIGRRF